MLTKEQKNQIIDQFKKNAQDVGSCEVQIGLLSGRINSISDHLKSFPKDKHSQLGLVKLVGKRKALMNYLKINDRQSFEKVSQLIR